MMSGAKRILKRRVSTAQLVGEATRYCVSFGDKLSKLAAAVPSASTNARYMLQL